MMLTPCWPSAGPTGGAGLAAPALIWSLMIAESFRFLGGISGLLVVVVRCGGVLGQILLTWLKPSSTGVSRPKIDTSTLSFWASTLTSLIVAGNVANGPSITVTDSPTSKATPTVGWAAASAPALAAALRGCSCFGSRNLSTSSMLSGEGRE